MSLRELARRLDVSPSLVSQIETGKIQPSVRTLYAIVSELGLSLDEIFELVGSTPSPRPPRRPSPRRAPSSARTEPLPARGGAVVHARRRAARDRARDRASAGSG